MDRNRIDFDGLVLSWEMKPENAEPSFCWEVECDVIPFAGGDFERSST